ncbi:hypothetical protein KAR91_77335 [Candidatus Pacearchaeota archaeon]|nr:hypothetical protein [Candidatus Pacearchaeota archaeon]
MEDRESLIKKIIIEENILDSIASNPNITKIRSQVYMWVHQAIGSFKLNEVTKDLGYTSGDDILAVKWYLTQLCENGEIKESKKNNGLYKKLTIELNKMQKVENRAPSLGLWLPLGLHEKVVVIRGSLIVVAGVTNSGKSGFFLNFVENNKDKYKIRYVSSEWSNEERDIQLEDFGVDIDEWDKEVDFYAKKDVTAAFDNYVDPENITIIDYLEIYDDYGAIAGALRDIADKLTTGIALVAIQKKPGSNHGYGGEGTVNRSQLYINIDRNEIDPRKRIATIRKLKKATDRKYSIEHLSCEFEFNEKGRIVNKTDWGKIVEVKTKGILQEKYVKAEWWANQKPKEEEEEAIKWSK